MRITVNTKSFFILFVFIYLLIFVVAFSILGESEKYVNNYDISSQNINFSVVYFSIQAVIGFFLGLRISGFEKYERVNYSPIGQKRIITAIITNTVFIFLLMGVFFLKDVQTVISGYQENYSHSFNAHSFSFLKFNLYISLSLLISYYLNNVYKIQGYILFVVLVFLGVVTSDKNPIVLGLLAVFSSFLIYQEGINVKKALLIMVSIFLFLIFTKLFSLFRSVGVEDIDFYNVLSNFKLSNIDGAGPYFSIVYFNENPTTYFGLSYINDILGFLPKFLYPDRPDGTSLLLAKELIEDWSPGQGLGLSPVAEGLNNFGYHGVVLHFFVIGVIWGWWWRLVRSVMQRLFYSDKEFFVIFYRVVGMYSLLMFFRGSGLGFIKSSIYIILPILFFQVIIFIIYTGSNNGKK
jgi:oligosaccharide repeat unit polymerase